MDLKDKVVVITGGSSGLGEAVAYQLADLGSRIILLARTEKDLKRVTDQINKKKGQADYFVCDITDLNHVKTTISQIVNKYKTIDILINNAGIWTDKEIEEKDPVTIENVFKTNALGQIFMTKSVLPIFKKQNAGHILFTISGAGYYDSDNTLWQVYGSSKWAMTGYVKSLKDDLKNTPIKVTGFYPGGFESMLYEKANRPNPHRQPWMMNTEDIAKAVIFCLVQPNDVLIETLVVSKK